MAVNTYINAVNSVLKRLREDTVGSVAQTDYSALIGELVNDAIEHVSEAWQWSTLKQSVTATLTSGTRILTPAIDAPTVDILQVTVPSENLIINKVLDDYYNQLETYDPTPTSDVPQYWRQYGFDTSTGRKKYQVWPTADQNYTLEFKIKIVQERLSTDAGVIYVPFRPVVLFAYADAVAERGEDGGTASTELVQKAQTSLANAIQYDLNNYSSLDTLFFIP